MFVAWRDLLFAKGRFGLMGLVIALVAFLMVLLNGLVAGLLHNTVSGIAQLPATHIAFEFDQRPTFGNTMVEKAMWEGWAKRPGVQHAEPAGYTIFNARVADERPVELVLWGIRPDSTMLPRVIEGEQIGRVENGIVVTEALAREKGVKIGDEITLDRVLTKLKVVGVAPAARIGHIPLAYALLPKWQEATYGPPGGAPPGDKLPDVLFDYASVVVLDIDPTVEPGAIAAADKELGTVTRTKEGAFTSAPAYTEELFTVKMIRGFLVFVATLIVGAFFVVWTIQRTKEIGLIKALGASNGYMLKDALGQALILLGGATIVGSICAYVVGQALTQTELAFRLPVSEVLSGGALLIFAGLVGAALSIRQIVRVDPIIALGRER
jgi:putative ABC transport system permease protein